MAFPVVKLMSVLVKQVSKPMAKYMQQRAVNNAWFRNACIAFAQTYHRGEQWVLRSFYDQKLTATYIRPLNEAKAIEVGTDMLGEIVVFSIVGGAVLWEYRRSAAKEADKERKLQTKLGNLQEQISVLQSENDRLMGAVFPNVDHVRPELPVYRQSRSWLWRTLFGDQQRTQPEEDSVDTDASAPAPEASPPPPATASPRNPSVSPPAHATSSASPIKPVPSQTSRVPPGGAAGGSSPDHGLSTEETSAVRGIKWVADRGKIVTCGCRFES
ncbi:unnamed protein product [Vitrella brassicaformis CCMP3155]|uniref:OPA3-like protein n=2 Tax=Vitrella brassicaformis TaxID=1169539 RepID=A0A0G4GE15_VITBC|nr:unnamed protein product [Vitrella brassicaformis CCMP3155]|mmetsp:Transcript_27274/g.68025  ORF Transcript_27274/g.68025 Transcript_27274/m.68025 type:complete len:271 (+) Transcript_27274:81-893(+)|eukprot:CEM27664.1 unnamed protein product [Vitrella brassicaformis CCMP3155]